jgi:putative tryptophan/tyrosine transport system substrate-binding protein
MRRRDFITLLGASAWPLSVAAQQPVMPVVGWLNSGPAGDPLFMSFASVFRAGLKDAGYIEGQNVAIDFRWGEGQYSRLPALAAELVAKRVHVIVAGGPPAALAAKAATASIPIVFTVGDDPVKLGLVTSLSRPGGNATGISTITSEIEAKRLGLLREVVPAATTIAVLLNGNSPTFETQSKDVQAGAKAIGLQIEILTANSEQLVVLASQQSLPTMFAAPDAVRIGGLMSYSISFADVYRQAGIYVGRILKGEKPSEMPVTRPTKFDLVINLRTAKTLGLSLSPGLLSIADEVIE